MSMEVRRRYTPILTPKVLWITDTGEEILDRVRFSPTVVPSALEGLQRLENEDFDVVLASLPEREESAVAILLEQLQQTQPTTPILIYAPGARATEIVRLLRLGAFHVFEHGDASSLLYLAANAKWAQESKREPGYSDHEPWRRLLIGQSRPMEQVIEKIRLVAQRRCTVLITGETGTGKELAARSIHAASNRAQGPMVCVNCGALPEALLEAELFGHVRGAFTGAVNHRIGRFEQANRGTIFLDEIGDMPFSLQSKLLRVLQEREFQRLGSSETIRVDVRVVAATHANLRELIEQGKFREDLYYRLNVVPISMPSLRERKSDVQILVRHFIEKICREENIPIKEISNETLNRLAYHDWPGNIRELENAVENAVVLSDERRDLFPGDFPLPRRKLTMARASGEQPIVAVPDHGFDFESTVGCIERNILEQALKKTGGNKKLAAEMLGLKRTTLSAKLKSLAAAGTGG
jgi:DNA-binding NtrC family response regulator